MTRRERRLRLVCTWVVLFFPALVLCTLEYLGEWSTRRLVSLEGLRDRILFGRFIRGREHSRFCACVICRRNKIRRFR